MVRSILFWILLLGVGHTASSQTVEEFREAAKQALEAYDAPGFSIGVIQDGEVIMSEGYGVNKVNTTIPVDGSTLYAIASNTKAFISTAITKLHVEGKLNLDDPVQKYLPYFQLYDEYVSQHTTVRDLLCHRVGLGTFSGDAIWYKNEKSAEDIIRQIKHLPQAYSWRSGYGYTNLMFITAGEVIRSVTGLSWSDYVRENFLTPLDMTRTQTSVSSLEGLDNIATPHVTFRDNLPIDHAVWDAAGAAGGIFSSTDDMLRWMKVQIDPTLAEAQNVFPADARNIAMTPHNPLNRRGHSSAALGWFTYVREGKTIVTHGGGYDGMYSRVMLIPELKTGIVVLTNSMTGLSSHLANYIRDTYLGRDTEGWLDRAIEGEKGSTERWHQKFEKPRDSRVANTTPSILPANLVGDYHDPLYGNVTVAVDVHDKITLHFADAPALTAKLTHWHYDTYEINWHEEHAWFDFGTVQFTVDHNLDVVGIKFDVPNNDIFFDEIEVMNE